VAYPNFSSIFFFLYNMFFPLPKAAILLGPTDGREWAHKKLVAVLAAEDEQDAAVVCNKQFNAAIQTDCVFQTPIRADRKGRYIRLNTDGLPFSAT